jgi:leucyl aminopeptidase
MATVKTHTKPLNDILVLGLSAADGKLSIHPNVSNIPSISKDSKKLLSILADLGATGAADEVIKVAYSAPRLIIFTGLGSTTASFSHETLRRAAGAAARELAGHTNVDFALPNKNTSDLEAIAEGIHLGAYSFTEFRGSTKADQKSPLKIATIITSIGTTSAAKKSLIRADVVSNYVLIVRDLVNTPPSHLNPITFSERMKKLSSGLGIKVEILNETQLRAKGYGGISSVGQGSSNPPRLFHISYNPARAKKRFAFVGKGITFDSGGYALKPASGMEDMKSDMSGAAAVIAATYAIATLKLPVAIDAYACLAENMISGHATRPSDIITIYGGKTVEVLNPDAEGRLVLADGLVRAVEDGRRNGGLDGIVDVATLTGAQVVALGTRTSAVMTNNQEFSAQFLEATGVSGEAFWPMPLPEELREVLNSPSADLANISIHGATGRYGGMLIAGHFLKAFVPDEIPWLHLDIAGPALADKAHGYNHAGGTGVSVRSLVTLAELAVSH